MTRGGRPDVAGVLLLLLLLLLPTQQT